ncbi:MAG: DUF2203 family protein [Legionellales bacterium]|jgi:hypothetical protein|nr:DUF2203 family protein [Legionellales bacterium]
MSFLIKNIGCTKTKNDRVFTAEEIENLIPMVESSFYRLLQMNAQINTIINQLKSQDVILSDSITLNSLSHSDEESINNLSSLKVLLSATQDEISFISKRGGTIPNIDEPIVNWNGKIDDNDIVFTWKLGDKKIEQKKSSITEQDKGIYTEEA